MARGFKSFSTGERRGLLALLIILSIIVAVSYFSMRSTGIQPSITTNDSTIISNISSAKDSSETKRRVKKKRKLKTKTAPPVIKPRDPLSQPVPIQEN